MKVLLCSTSTIKSEALNEFLSQRVPNFTIDTFDCSALGLPNQPIRSTLKCAKARLDYAKKMNSGKYYDLCISIENGIEESTSSKQICDTCYIFIEGRGYLSVGACELAIPETLLHLLPFPLTNGLDHELGNNVTFGEKLQKEYPDLNIDPKNWMKTICNFDRVKMILESLTNAESGIKTLEKDTEQVLKAYKSYPDFPKPGVLFQDIFAVLADKNALQTLVKLMASRYQYDKIDYVVGLESRGFFGVLLAKELGFGFVPIRKAGKLPGEVKRIEYGTEYSKDSCEISTSIPPGSRVLVFDDLIATGGSLKASVLLLNDLKCEIVDCCVLREVVSLRQQARETMGDQSYTVLLQE